jgi:hypothetical protein
MSARSRAGSLGLMKAKCLYETCFYYFGSGSFGAPAVPFSSDALGMPWEFMEINKNYHRPLPNVAIQSTA